MTGFIKSFPRHTGRSMRSTVDAINKYSEARALPIEMIAHPPEEASLTRESERTRNSRLGLRTRDQDYEQVQTLMWTSLAPEKP